MKIMPNKLTTQRDLEEFLVCQDDVKARKKVKMRLEFDIKIKGKTEVPEERIAFAIKKFVTNLEATKVDLAETLKGDLEYAYGISANKIDVKINLIKEM